MRSAGAAPRMRPNLHLTLCGQPAAAARMHVYLLCSARGLVSSGIVHAAAEAGYSAA